MKLAAVLIAALFASVGGVTGAMSSSQANELTGPTYGGPKPSKKLDFEEGFVEGLNKRPLDAFHQMSEADRNGKIPHLYKKRTGFSEETAETLKQVRYSQ